MKLKPITIINAHYSRYRQNTTQQILLLRALKITRDPEKLRQIIGVKKVADVFRTLDKIAMRKEFHQALIKCGIDFEYIITGLKGEAETAEESADRIRVYQILLKSLGMDKYDDVADGGSSLEDVMVKNIEEKKVGLLTEGLPVNTDGDYPVFAPVVPESVKKSQAEEQEIGKSLYD